MSLSKILKESTKRAHQETEKTVVLRIKAIKSEEDYINLLKYFYAYFGAVERKASSYITEDILSDHADRRDASYIQSDIHELGGETDSLPVPNPPTIADSLQAMSALYVLEGSVIGGPYIVDMLRKIGITRGISFFSGYGEQAERKWETFTEHLDSLSHNEHDTAVAVDKAIETFQRFGEIFSNRIPDS